jgi:FKBP-type peptidyl-prolyl cis-trans isomerase SlyD
MKISEKKVVIAHYTLYENDTNGAMVESTEGAEPLGYIQGIGMMIPDFEKNLEGMQAGDEFSFGIKAEDAYGQYDDDGLHVIEKKFFHLGEINPDDVFIVGEFLPLQDDQGNHMNGLIVEVHQDTVKLDFNHPMAGIDLYFTGKVDTVRDATEEELTHGHVHGTGGHHH